MRPNPEIAIDRLDDIRRAARGVQRLEIVNALQLLRKPAPRREWTVEPWIPRREVTLLSGDGGTGKSMIALQLCASSVACLLWFGLEVRHGAALYVSCEDDVDEVHYRLEQIRAHEPDADFSGLHIVSLAGKETLLTSIVGNRQQPTPLFAELEKACADLEISLLVLDASADMYGGNEVDRAQTRAFIQMLRGLAIRRNLTIVLLAHPSVDGMKTGRGYSGSSAWNNSVRSRLYFTRATADNDSEPDPDLRILELAKSNRGKIGNRIVMRWHKGCFVIDGAHESSIDRLSRDLETEAIFLELLDAYNDRSRYVSDKAGHNYAPKLFSEDPAAAGTTKKQFGAGMNRLFTSDRIAVEEFGPPSRRQRRIVRAAQ